MLTRRLELRQSVQTTLPPQFSEGTFADTTWTVRKPGHAVYRIRWDSVELKDGTLLTDGVNAELLHATKTALALIATGVGSSKKTPKASSFETIFLGFRWLVIWMSSRGLRSFRDLTMAHVIGYRNWTRNRKAKHTRRRTKDAGITQLAQNTQVHALQPIRYLVRLQPYMGDLGTKLAPHEVEDALSGLATKTRHKTERIPDDIFQRFVAAAIQIIEHAEPFIQLKSDYECTRTAARAAKATTARYHFMKTIEGQRGKVVPFGTQEFDLGSLTAITLRDTLLVISGACFSVIAGMVGMRMSEVRTLRVNCLRSVPLDDGRIMLKLAGTLFKTSRASEGEPAEWVAGWDGPKNPVRMAVQVLEDIAKASGSQYLFHNTWGFPERIASDMAITRERLERFVEFVGFRDVWRFEPHQFRKTFARFVALSGPRATMALMRHYKHVSVQMTEQYFPNDPEMLNDIMEASEELLAASLDRVFGAERLAGIKGKEIISQNAAYRGDAAAKQRQQIIQMTLSDPSARFLLHVYGMCIYDEQAAKCQGELANIGLGTCSGCKNFVVENDALPFWKEHVRRLQENIAALAAAGIVNIDLQKQLEDATKILRDLGDDGQAA